MPIVWFILHALPWAGEMLCPISDRKATGAANAVCKGKRVFRRFTLYFPDFIF
jgi:hypothetical protein